MIKSRFKLNTRSSYADNSNHAAALSLGSPVGKQPVRIASGAQTGDLYMAGCDPSLQQKIFVNPLQIDIVLHF